MRFEPFPNPALPWGYMTKTHKGLAAHGTVSLHEAIPSPHREPLLPPLRSPLEPCPSAREAGTWGEV
jgi:hypothetical protein